MIRVYFSDPDPDYLPIPSRGVNKTQDPGSATLITNNKPCANGTIVGGG
jgi:hypothetical protein